MATADHPAWRTSSFTDNGGSCVEVAPGDRVVRVRDTKDRGLGPVLLLDHAGWTELRNAAAHGRPGAADGIAITHTEHRTRHAGTEVVTTWHVRTGDHELHFTDTEWTAFAAGVHAGEFASSPT